MSDLPKFVQALLPAAILAMAMPAAANCSPLLNHGVARLQDGAVQSLCQYQGKVILVVNTATFCGSIGQYDGMQSVYDKYLIARDGSRVDSYSSLTAPDSRTLIAHIERWLAEKP